MQFNDALEFLGREHTAVVTTFGRSGRAQATIVRAGPYEGEMTFVVRGATVKLANLRRDPRCTVLTVSPDWRKYVTVEGSASVHAPDNTSAEELRLLLRAAFAAAGGTHDDWEEFDRVMADQGRAVIVVAPERVYGSA